jgi:CheY-like chemotaxis protein
MKVARTMLTRMNLDVDQAWNGLECLQKCAVTPYDLIFLDVQMPVCDGFEAIARLRSEPGPNQDAKVVALTANAMESDKDKYAGRRRIVFVLGCETLAYVSSAQCSCR